MSQYGMSIQHFQALTEKEQYQAISQPGKFQVFEKLDGTGFSIHHISSRFYSKRIGDSTLYPLHPRDGEPVWVDEIWTHLFRTAHGFFKTIFFDGRSLEDFVISYEILSSDYPNAITYMPYGMNMNLVVELDVSPAYLRSSIGAPDYYYQDMPVTKRSISDELVLTETKIYEKWLHVVNQQKSHLWKYLVKNVKNGSPSETFDHFNNLWLTTYSWVPNFLKKWGNIQCKPAPMEGIVVVGPDFKFKMVERNWFLSLTGKNYEFRKKLFKTPHKKSGSVGDLHYQGIQSGLPKRLCDSLAVHRTIDEYQAYYPTRYNLEPATRERNKEAVYTSLKRYGW